MIEPEMAFCDLAGDMDLAEALLKHLVRDALEHCAEDLAFFAKYVDKGLMERLKFVVERPFRAGQLHGGSAVAGASRGGL